MAITVKMRSWHTTAADVGEYFIAKVGFIKIKLTKLKNI